ncbi:MAG TPA: fatty acid--CoA ligase, partial [Porticoccaceae bacterium]|nr:fatty acid--CoA ligase [Porticoccaceae bacterium]
MSTPVPVPLLDQKLTAPGSPFEMEEVDINGLRTRVWKQAKPHLRAILEDTLQFAERDYLVYESERMTYGRHYQQVAALAHALIEDYGIGRGDRVALTMRNYPEWPVIFWATVSVGAVIVPLNAWWTGRELEYAIDNCGARLVFADQQRASLLAGACDHIHTLEKLIVIRGEDNAISPNEDRFEDLLQRQSQREKLPEIDIAPDDDASIYYTSGTTGNPKGVV